MNLGAVTVTRFEQKCVIIAALATGRCPSCGEYGVDYSDEDEGLRVYYHTAACGTWVAKMWRKHVILTASEVTEDV